jgi:Tol biopolymer transport system component
MNIDQALHTLMVERAERYQVPAPDVSAFRVGGLARRRRHRRITALATAAALLVAALGGAAAWNAWSDDRSSTGPAITPDRTESVGALYFVDLNTGDRTRANNFSPDADYRFSPDGSRVACTGHCFGETGRLFVADSDGTDQIQLHPPDGYDEHGQRVWTEPQNIVWTPDATGLFYQLGAAANTINVRDIVRHDIATDETTPITDFAPRDRFYCCTFDLSPNGSTVIYSRSRGTSPDHVLRGYGSVTAWDLWSQPITGGDPTLLLRDAGAPGYLADGESVAFVDAASHAFSGPNIWIATNETRRNLATFTSQLWSMQMSPDRSKILFTNQDGISIVDVATGDTSQLYGNTAVWAGDDRLLAACFPTADPPLDEESNIDSCS